MTPFRVLQKQIDYKGCPIIIRLVGNETFEYITCINGEIYSANIVAKKKLSQRILMKGYTTKQLSDITNYVIAMAQTTIETILNGKKEPQKGSVLSPFSTRANTG
jgi:hypothetical protein